MDKLRELVESLHKRSVGLKEAANLCSPEEDRFALLVRADETERCAAAIEKVIVESKGDH